MKTFFIRYKSNLITLFLLLLLVVPVFLPARAQDDTDWVEKSIGEEKDKAREGEVNKGGYDKRTHKDSQSNWVDDIAPMKGISYEDEAYFPQLFQRSASFHISKAVYAMYTVPPASTYLALRDFGESLGFLPKQTYAQGIGFAGLAPLLPIWKVFRNIAYGLVAIIMIVIGFMVMFRKHIDPKTVVTVQNALPKIVVTLILITFSYAIVGLLVDLMYLLILLAVGMLQGILPPLENMEAGPFPLGQQYTDHAHLYTSGGLGGLLRQVFDLWPGSEQGLNQMAQKIIGISDATMTKMRVGGALGFIVGKMLDTKLFEYAGAAVATFPEIIGLLIALALLFLLIRLFIFFLSSYIQIIVSLIFAPIQLVMEAMPGSTAFGDWIKNLIANLIVFPVAAVIFMIASYFASLPESNTSLWVAPYVTIDPTATQVSALISVAILFTIPTIAGGIRESLKSKAFVDAGPGTIVGALSGPTNLLMQGFHMWQSHQTTKYLGQQAGLAKQQKGH